MTVLPLLLLYAVTAAAVFTILDVFDLILFRIFIFILSAPETTTIPFLWHCWRNITHTQTNLWVRLPIKSSKHGIIRQWLASIRFRIVMKTFNRIFVYFLMIYSHIHNKNIIFDSTNKIYINFLLIPFFFLLTFETKNGISLKYFLVHANSRVERNNIWLQLAIQIS